MPSVLALRVTSTFGVCSFPVLLLSRDLKIFGTFSLYVILDTLFWLSQNILEYHHGWYFLQYVALNYIKGVQLTKYHCVLFDCSYWHFFLIPSNMGSSLLYLTTSSFLVLSSFQC